MSVKRLLTEMDSYELTAWQQFLKVEARVREEQQERATYDASILGAGK